MNITRAQALAVVKSALVILAVAGSFVGLAYVAALIAWLYTADLSRLAYHALYPYQAYEEGEPFSLPMQDKIAFWLLYRKEPAEFKEMLDSESIQLENVFGRRSRKPRIRSEAALRAALVADLFIAKGLDPEERDRYGCSAVQRAMFKDDPEAVCYLMARGASTAGHGRARMQPCRTSVDEAVQRRTGLLNACEFCRQDAAKIVYRSSARPSDDPPASTPPPSQPPANNGKPL
jgi:hypothetical protein